MNHIFELTRYQWIRAQLQAPPSMQQWVMPRMHEAKEIARLLIRPRLPVYEWRGQGAGGPLTVMYAGSGFTKRFFKDLLFVSTPVEEEIGRLAPWRCGEVAHLSRGDMTIVHATKHLIRKLPGQGAMVLPEHVGHIVDTRGDWQEVRSRFRKSVCKNELRFVRKYGYEYHLSQDSTNFAEFYHCMYLPTMKARHGRLSSPMSFSEASLYFRYGWLIQIRTGGDWVSGAVCHPQGEILVLRLLGVRNGDVGLMRQGAASTLYYAAIHWANQNGYEAVDFLRTRPLLQSGTFQHKRKWGSSVRVSQVTHRWVWIRIQRMTPAVRRFLKENPFAVLEGKGDLHGLVVVEDGHEVSPEEKNGWERRFVTPGLHSLLVRSVDSFVPGSQDTKEAELVIPIIPNSSHGNQRS